MILILSDEFDIHTDIVVQKLAAKSIPCFRFNLNVEALIHSTITFHQGHWIINQNGSLHSSEISCVWCRRPFVELTLEEQQIQTTDFRIWKNEWNKTLLGFYNSLKSLPWLNPLRKAYKGENKYYQMELAAKVGFELPATIVSNDKSALLCFTQQHNGAILKLMSQEIYSDGADDFLGFYTNQITLEDLQDFNLESENPVVLQQYIEKKFEVRYTVVGTTHYVCCIDSQKSEYAKRDWRRYDIPHTPHYAIEAPSEIKHKVQHFMSLLQLDYGALDFIVTPDNRWVFLEINCMGQWLWIEQLTALPISDGIVDWLISHQ